MTLTPLAEAVKKIDAKTPIGSVLRSREWEHVPLALRERAQFSAGVTSARVLQTIQDRISKQLKLQREAMANGKEAIFDRSSFIDELRDIARQEGLTPDEGKGTITDITSIPRLGMIYDMQNQMATGFARWKFDASEGAMLLWPAWRLVREREAKVPRDWRARWAEAGEAVGWEGADEGSMVALKTSPIWAKLSRFGTPWPPFDYNSGMGVEDVDRDEAIALGLMEDGKIPEASGEEDFNEGLEASTKGLGDELIEKLERAFKGQIDISSETIRWSQPVSGAAPSRHGTTEAAFAKLDKGFDVESKAGFRVKFAGILGGHLRGSSDTQRARFLPAAEATVRNPVEVWEMNHRHYYIGRFKKKDGTTGFIVVAARKGENADEVITMFPKSERELGKFRDGKLVYRMNRAVS